MISNQQPAGAKKISLGEFVKHLVLALDKDQVLMPFQNERKWHELFYKLKTTQRVEGRPSFLDKLRFDWDGPYPRCQDLSECLQTLHWNGFVSVANPSYDKLSVDVDVSKEEKKKPSVFGDNQLDQYLQLSVKEASSFFSASHMKVG